jgi:hypothetical protein
MPHTLVSFLSSTLTKCYLAVVYTSHDTMNFDRQCPFKVHHIHIFKGCKVSVTFAVNNFVACFGLFLLSHLFIKQCFRSCTLLLSSGRRVKSILLELITILPDDESRAQLPKVVLYPKMR